MGRGGGNRRQLQPSPSGSGFEAAAAAAAANLGRLLIQTAARKRIFGFRKWGRGAWSRGEGIWDHSICC